MPVQVQHGGTPATDLASAGVYHGLASGPSGKVGDRNPHWHSTLPPSALTVPQVARARASGTPTLPATCDAPQCILERRWVQRAHASVPRCCLSRCWCPGDGRRLTLAPPSLNCAGYLDDAREKVEVICLLSDCQKCGRCVGREIVWTQVTQRFRQQGADLLLVDAARTPLDSSWFRDVVERPIERLNAIRERLHFSSANISGEAAAGWAPILQQAYRRRFAPLVRNFAVVGLRTRSSGPQSSS